MTDGVAMGTTTREHWELTFSDKKKLAEVASMLMGYEKVYGIHFVPVLLKSDESKFAFIGLMYPPDVLEYFVQVPQEKVSERLKKRGITAHLGDDGLAVYWPIKAIEKLARVWGDLDAAGATCMCMTERGMVVGTIQQF